MSSAAHVCGDLATHARGRTLAASFGATPCETLPDAGALLVLGTEFQGKADRAHEWVRWAATPGRVLIILPPFRRGPCRNPVRWEARQTEPLAGGETELGKLLARERRYEIRGQLLPLERYAGQVATAGWRKHPTAGLVAITGLPIWSLTALDHRTACAAWLANLLEQAGRPVAIADDEEKQEESQSREPTADEWALMLHLCTGPFSTDREALDALLSSAIHDIPKVRAEVALKELAELGLARDGALTSKGERTLLAGPFAHYARALRRQHER